MGVELVADFLAIFVHPGFALRRLFGFGLLDHVAHIAVEGLGDGPEHARGHTRLVRGFADDLRQILVQLLAVAQLDFIAVGRVGAADRLVESLDRLGAVAFLRQHDLVARKIFRLELAIARHHRVGILEALGLDPIARRRLAFARRLIAENADPFGRRTAFAARSARLTFAPRLALATGAAIAAKQACRPARCGCSCRRGFAFATRAARRARSVTHRSPPQMGRYPRP